MTKVNQVLVATLAASFVLLGGAFDQSDAHHKRHNDRPARDCSHARCYNPSQTQSHRPQAPKPNPYATTTAENLRPSMPGYVWVGGHWERVKAPKTGTIVVRDHRTLR
jgi:hypothetical protein